MSANWIFDLNAPEPDNEDEPDHTEQNAHYTDTLMHITHVFPDSFTGTSFGYQSREEYDYTAMMIALNDILNKLRHHNGAEAKRDMLLRNIHRKQEEIRITFNQLRDSYVDYVERIEHNMDELIKQMIYVRVEVSSMREYMQHVPYPEFGRGCIGRHRGRGRHH